MRATEINAIGELAEDALAAGAGLIQQLHEGVSGRPLAILGAAGVPVRIVHDRIVTTVYDCVRAGLRAGARTATVAARTAAALSAPRAGNEAVSLVATPRGAVALGALNGLFGNHLATAGNGLAVDMEIRRHGDAVAATPRGLARGFPDAGSRVALFIHGLCETEESWRRRRPPGRDGSGAARRTYGERLQDELGFTPVHLRYNSGLRISDNGRRLAELLDDVVASWPVPLSELVLVGHSMGGLVARSACHYGQQNGASFTGVVRRVLCLGSPHLGADLEKGINVIAWGCGQLPETRALRGFLNARSVGIKDLRFGSCLEVDWRECDPDELLRDRCQEVLFLADADYYFIAASLRDPALGLLLGDLLVRTPSASGRGRGSGRRVRFEAANGRELRGLTHFDLLNHPAVYEQIRTWIVASDRRQTSGSGGRLRSVVELVGDGQVVGGEAGRVVVDLVDQQLIESPRCSRWRAIVRYSLGSARCVRGIVTSACMRSARGVGVAVCRASWGSE